MLLLLGCDFIFGRGLLAAARQASFVAAICQFPSASRSRCSVSQVIARAFKRSLLDKIIASRSGDHAALQGYLVKAVEQGEAAMPAKAAPKAERKASKSKVGCGRYPLVLTADTHKHPDQIKGRA